MSDWRLEQRKQRGEHIDDTAGAREQASKVLGGLKSFFIGDTPSEMAFNAATMGALPLKALRVPMMGLSALSAADDAQAGPLAKLRQLVTQTRKMPKPKLTAEDLGTQYMTKTPGPAQSGRVFTPEQLNELRDQLEFYTKARALPPEHANSLQMLMKAAEEPGMKTHVLYTGSDFTEPTAAFQLTPDHDLELTGQYMPNLVSLLGMKGQGTQALQEARRAGPYGLVATPKSKDFYEKMLGQLDNFGPVEDVDLRGVAYEYKKKGGLVEAHGVNTKQALPSIYQRLQDVLASVAPDSYAQDAVNRLKNEHSYAKEYKLGLNGLGLPMEKFGLNLTSQPQVYLPPTIKKEFVRENKDLPYDIGGQSSPLRGIELNPYSRMFDKAGTLVHEVSHQRDYGASGVRPDLPKDVGARIIDKISKHKAAGNDYRRMRILSGQQEPDEIRAQLRAYEALLPAGMPMFQSPLGKEVFQTPEEKLWYINQTQPSMTDQKYLEELAKQNFAKGGLVEADDDFAYPGMF